MKRKTSEAFNIAKRSCIRIRLIGDLIRGFCIRACVEKDFDDRSMASKRGLEERLGGEAYYCRPVSKVRS